MRRLVYVSGKLGAGKTSLAFPLAAELGYSLVTKDLVKETLHDVGRFAPIALTSPGCSTSVPRSRAATVRRLPLRVEARVMGGPASPRWAKQAPVPHEPGNSARGVPRPMRILLA